MKDLDFRFWLLAVWFAGSVIFLSAAAETPDVSLTLAAVVNLIFCASTIKAHKEVFDDAVENML